MKKKIFSEFIIYFFIRKKQYKMEEWVIILISVVAVFIGLPCLMMMLGICWVSYIKNAAPRPLDPKFKDKRAIVRCLCEGD